jgi:hypothetical protein
MATGWSCPECGLILAPHVNEHRCDPPEAGVSVRPVVAPHSPSTGTYTWPTESTITVVPGGHTLWTTGSGGGGGSPNAQEWLCCSSWPSGVSWGERAA